MNEVQQFSLYHWDLLLALAVTKFTFSLYVDLNYLFFVGDFYVFF